MDILSTFDVINSPDFFEVNPQFEISFKRVREVYPDNYSKLMWAICLLLHPKSIYKNLDESTRKRIILREYLDVDETSSQIWDDLSLEIELFKDLILTKKEKFLIEWERKLDERQNFISSLPYNANTYELLDKMMGVTDKMWKQYLSCLKDVEEESSKMSNIEGGAIESPSEQHLI